MTYYQLNEPDVSIEIFDTEILAINLKTGHYQSLSHTSAVFFRLLTDGHSIEQIAEKTTTIYNIDTAVIKEDLTGFIQNLVENKLIIKAEYPLSASDSSWLESVRDAYATPVLENYTDMQDLLVLDPIHEVSDTGWPNIGKERK